MAESFAGERWNMEGPRREGIGEENRAMVSKRDLKFSPFEKSFCFQKTNNSYPPQGSRSTPYPAFGKAN